MSLPNSLQPLALNRQVSVLTDQVEAQGEKIRDLEFCLEEHREKLNATEEMLQQVWAKAGGTGCRTVLAEEQPSCLVSAAVNPELHNRCI